MSVPLADADGPSTWVVEGMRSRGDLRRELEHGRGLVLLHGLPAEAYEEEELQRVLAKRRQGKAG